MMAQRLREEGIRFREIDFPRYGNPFAEPAGCIWLVLWGIIRRCERVCRIYFVRR